MEDGSSTWSELWIDPQELQVVLWPSQEHCGTCVSVATLKKQNLKGGEGSGGGCRCGSMHISF